MKFRLLTLIAICFVTSLSGAAHAETVVPRTIYALYYSAHESSPRDTLIHRNAEAPLNYLGYSVKYFDVAQPLPKFTDDIAGMLIWFNPGTKLPNPDLLLDWLSAGLDAKKQLIIMGDIGISDSYRDTKTGITKLRAVLNRIGVEDHDLWFRHTYQAAIEHQDPKITPFEHNYFKILPNYNHTTKFGDKAVSHLSLRNRYGNDETLISDMIITHPNGGYIAPDYALFTIQDEEGNATLKQWYINPFVFFNEVLPAASLLKPDATTVNGKRIFYSHMDGDGWNNITEIPKYQRKQAIAAEVLYEEIFKLYGDVPFNVSVIVDELEPACYGLPKSKDIAKKIFALPNVEPASHTHSHPLFWDFFADGNISKEIPYLSKYPKKTSAILSIYDAMEKGWFDELPVWDPEKIAAPTDIKKPMPHGSNEDSFAEIMKHYDTPRSYACEPFDIRKEIVGSVEYVRALAPGKDVKLIQWPGDTSPFEEALRLARENGIYNINGGDTRLDREFPSYTYVAPIGVEVGKERQIYSSNSNENTYTDLWTERFFGFKLLADTARNTDSPYRLTPFNIYFHTYSGSKTPSLAALKANIDYALKQDTIPLYTSHYTAIANGFYGTEIIADGENRWRIRDRGALQTIRLDSEDSHIDWTRSEGVLGEYLFQSQLYIALDPTSTEPVVALSKDITNDRPYLVQSRWMIENLGWHKNILTFTASGFGNSNMRWYWPYKEPVRIEVSRNNSALLTKVITVNDLNELLINIDLPNSEPVEIKLFPAPETANLHGSKRAL